ncbi:MAG: ABC transporter permease [Bacteroidales bacterium]|nr:ABC transporter permease [Bacteroidales bacterium]
MQFFYHLGRYILLLKKVIEKPEKQSIYYKRLIDEIENLGINSIGIVIIISIFSGAAITIQTAYNIENPLLPSYLIGVGARDSLLLEFSSTMVALILAGKIGSSIASELGTMRISEQIDALEMMGVNSASYLIFPKIIGLMIFSPILTILSVFVGITGGFFAAILTGVATSEEYIMGIQYVFIPFYVAYAIIKSIVFAFLITSISAYHGYYVSGGVLEVSRSSTRAAVHSSIFIIIFNLILTQLLLS